MALLRIVISDCKKSFLLLFNIFLSFYINYFVTVLVTLVLSRSNKRHVLFSGNKKTDSEESVKILLLFFKSALVRYPFSRQLFGHKRNLASRFQILCPNTGIIRIYFYSIVYAVLSGYNPKILI